MGKVTKVFVCGMKGVGKTAMLQQIIYGKLDYQDIHPTIEDMYAATVLNDKGTREILRFYDTEGLGSPDDIATDNVLPRQVYSAGDAFILVYSVNNSQSFAVVDVLKKDIEKNRDKREIVTVAIGLQNPFDNQNHVVDPKYVASWGAKEKVRNFLCEITNRESLFAPVVYIASKVHVVPPKASFAPLGMVRKSKEAVPLGVTKQ